jgi:hypothetical protein
MKKYDYYVADEGPIPHAGVHLTADRTRLVAMFVIDILSVEQATTLARDLTSRLNADGAGNPER